MRPYKGSTSGLYPELSQALSPEDPLSLRHHRARRVEGALELPHSGFPNPRMFCAALLLGLDHICLQATSVSVSQGTHRRAPRRQSCRHWRCLKCLFNVRSLSPGEGALCQELCKVLGPQLCSPHSVLTPCSLRNLPDFSPQGSQPSIPPSFVGDAGISLHFLKK